MTWEPGSHASPDTQSLAPEDSRECWLKNEKQSGLETQEHGHLEGPSVTLTKEVTLKSSLVEEVEEGRQLASFLLSQNGSVSRDLSVQCDK